MELRKTVKGKKIFYRNILNRYAWTRMLKDIQKLYRLIFKKRFHRLDKRDDSKSATLVKKFMSEIGITHEGDVMLIFHYLYQQLHKLRKASR